MQAKIPVLACTDRNTDIGKVIEEAKFGWWSESKDVQDFSNIVKGVSEEQIKQFGLNGYQYLKENYSVEQAYDIIMNRVGKKNENYCK